MNREAIATVSELRIAFDKKTLPNGWRLARLGDVCDVVNGFGFAEHLQGRKDLPYPFIKVSDMNAEGSATIVNFAANTVDGEILKSLRAKTYPAGTVIFPKVGGALLTNKKRVLGVEATFDNNIMGVVPREVETEWLFFWSRTIDLRTLANTQALPSIRQSQVAALQIPLPPIHERKRIGAILTKQMAVVERARTAAEEQLAAARALFGAYLREVFESEECKKWETKKLGHLCLNHGQYGTSTKADASELAGVPVLGMANLFEGGLRWDRLSYISLDDAELDKYRLVKDDILFNRTNSAELVGKTAVFDGSRDAIFASYLVRFRVQPRIADPHFISAYINSRYGRHFIEANMTRAIGQANLSASTMVTMSIPTPTLERQMQISRHLRSATRVVDQIRSGLHAEIETINKMPAAMLRQAFNGEL